MGFLAAFIAEVGLVTYRGFARPGPLGHLPLPATFTAVALVYGLLGLLVKTQAEPVATALGWGFVVATFFNVWNPTAPTAIGKQKAKVTA